MRKKHRHIHREELLAFLCGKTLPQRNRMGGSSGRQCSRVGLDRSIPRHGIGHNHGSTDSIDHDLAAFREAIALQGK